MTVPTTQDVVDTKVPVNYAAIKRHAAKLLSVPVRDLTQQQLADLFGTSKKTITRYATGQGASLGVVKTIAKKLGISIEQVTGGESPDDDDNV